jgi:hypothetical protein
MPRDYFFELSLGRLKTGTLLMYLLGEKMKAFSKKKVADDFVIHRLFGLNLTFGGVIQEYPYLPRLSAKLEMLRPDIIHGESHLFLPTVQAVRKAKKLDLPCVVTVHGVFADRGAAINFFQDTYIRTFGSVYLLEMLIRLLLDIS